MQLPQLPPLLQPLLLRQGRCGKGGHWARQIQAGFTPVVGSPGVAALRVRAPKRQKTLSPGRSSVAGNAVEEENHHLCLFRPWSALLSSSLLLSFLLLLPLLLAFSLLPDHAAQLSARASLKRCPAPPGQRKVSPGVNHVDIRTWGYAPGLGLPPRALAARRSQTCLQNGIQYVAQQGVVNRTKVSMEGSLEGGQETGATCQHRNAQRE